MKKTILSIILKLFLCAGYAQNQAVVKILIPAQKDLTNMKHLTVKSIHRSFDHKIFLSRSCTEKYLFCVNEYPLLKTAANLKSKISVSTQLAFADVLESYMNNIKTGLISTYDDSITALFKDAPSMLQFTCIISL